MELQPNQISELITKHLIDELSKKEKETLSIWLEDPYNKLQFDKITNSKACLDKFDRYKQYNTNKAWKKFQKKKAGHRVSIMAYAAVLLLPLLLGFFVFYFSPTKTQRYSSINIPNSYQLQNKTILILNDGTLCNVSKKDTSISSLGITVNSKNNLIHYNKLKKQEKFKDNYNILNVPKGNQHQLLLEDGTKVWLNSQTRFKYPVNFDSDKREVFILEGEAFFDVSKNKNQPFIVHFNNRKIEVTGTQFDVKTYQEEDFDCVTLIEGSVIVHSLNNSFKLSPDQQAKINKNNDFFSVETIDAYLYGEWRNKLFIYKNERLDVIMRDLERHYNIKTFYRNEEIKNKKFSLRIKQHSDFKKLLEVMESTQNINFTINGNNVIIQ